jgi:hypothetical protein
VQPSPLLPQARQVPPWEPHWVDDGETQGPVELAQQPAAHELASQTHEPLWHSRPAAQAGPLPHVHAPVDEHPSAPGPQLRHAAPLAPHAEAEGVEHTDPLQQPVGHELELQFVQAPALQIWFWQELHCPPPAPHAVCTLPGRHAEPLQHPSQEVESHTQLPFEQCWPDEQGGPPPQVHAPCDEHPSPRMLPAPSTHAAHAPPGAAHAAPVVGDVQVPAVVQQPVGHEVASHVQAPSRHRCPTAHSPLAPQRHTPAGEQLSVRAPSHAAHWLPSVPHAAKLDVSHALPEQHPVGHEVELQMHVPFEQI